MEATKIDPQLAAVLSTRGVNEIPSDVFTALSSPFEHAQKMYKMNLFAEFYPVSLDLAIYLA